MKTSEFVYKKTKKIVKKYRGLEVCLSEQDAADLLELLKSVGGSSKARIELFEPLTLKLLQFLSGTPIEPTHVLDKYFRSYDR